VVAERVAALVEQALAQPRAMPGAVVPRGFGRVLALGHANVLARAGRMLNHHAARADGRRDKSVARNKR